MCPECGLPAVDEGNIYEDDTVIGYVYACDNNHEWEES